MKFIAFLLLAFLTISSSSLEEEKIEWNENYKLSWEDFKANPIASNGYVASTSSGISFSYSFSHNEVEELLDLKVSVTSYFYPEKSWFITTDVSSYILKHEQTHFDISELHARFLRKEIAETTFTKNIKEEIDAIYNRIENNRRKMQHLFDSESDHSKNKVKELEWEAYVTQQIKRYERWK